MSFKEVSLEKSQDMRTEQTLICTEKSIITSSDINQNKQNKIKIDKIKIIDFDKENEKVKIREKFIEKRGLKSIKVRFYN